MREEPWKIHLPTRVLIDAVGKGLEVPEEGWTARTFARQGRLLILTLNRIAKMTQRRAAPYIARTANAIFARQLDKVIARATGKSAKTSFLEIAGITHEGLWTQAINEVFEEEGIAALAELVPPIQSVMGQAYSRTGILLGQESDPQFSMTIAQKSREIAQRIVGINDTTRDLFRRTIQRAIDDGLTVTETAERLRDMMPHFSASRINTIARTETNNAWTRGSVASFQEIKTLSHVSVIGCEAREPSSPQYRGESTCNIEDVPVEDAGLLDFHPNHTGTIVPSRFRE
jgi:hypothetical protein